MRYTRSYVSPLGDILLASDGAALTGLWFVGQKHFADGLAPDAQDRDLPVFRRTGAWLDAYFSGREPGPLPPLRAVGTDFQRRVWEALLTVPHGQIVTYGALTRSLGLSPGSVRAVGGAVGRNRISILIPCHRVVGTGGSLTGYAGGIERKQWLLDLERTQA